MQRVGVVALAAVLTTSGAAIAVSAQELFSGFRGHGRGDRVAAKLVGDNEVPVVSTPARGRFEAEIDDDAIDYELTFTGLQAPVTQAHIHMAQQNVNGGIVLWLCGTATNPGPAGTPACPESGTITGTLTAANIVVQTTQGIQAGDFAEIIRALKNELAYANVHTGGSPGGEIRGQIVRRGR